MMPTGYTVDVQSGAITELAPFAMQLARGMGALVMMRDEPGDAPIPERFEPSPYHSERLAEAQAENRRLTAMSDDEAQAAADAEYAELIKERDEDKARHDVQRQRYLDMIAKVKAWKGAPEGIKGFALQQLQDSLDFDCREPYRYWREIKQQTGAAWRSEMLIKAARDARYHSEELDKEIDRVEKRNAWLAQLRASLA